jgi:hypothetical protein
MDYKYKYFKYKLKIQNMIGSGGIDNSKMFMEVINMAGNDEVLAEFCRFLGREDCEIYIPSTGERSSRHVQIPSNFTGLAFNGAHWKGYEKGIETYDSYKSNIQLNGTNNYCQSFACFLYASKGFHNTSSNVTEHISLVPFKYVENVQKISFLWYEFLTNSINGKYGPKYKKWIKKTVPNIENIIITTQILTYDDDMAHDFSTSKE